jgi:hypothetical protein
MEMSAISTHLQFTGKPRLSTTISGSEFRGTACTTAVPIEGYSNEMERNDKLGTIREVEVGSSRSNGTGTWHVV